VPSSETTMSEEKCEMLKTKLEFFSGLITWKIRLVRAIGVDDIDHFLISYLPESVTKLAAASEHQTQRVLSSFPWAHDDDRVDEVEDVEDTLEQPLDVQTRVSVPLFNPLSESSVQGSKEWPTQGQSSFHG
jgi:hypothetical protein